MIKAGGHPFEDQRYEINAGVDFLARAEFSVNTDGFCAADEMFFVTQAIARQSPEFAAFPGVLYWNTNEDDLTCNSWIWRNLYLQQQVDDHSYFG